ncbi:MAG: cell division protein ZapA [Desulfovibrionaceae bacterium]|nr:cell division protein ZapA [Desulfovibrionaceae bacterium]
MSESSQSLNVLGAINLKFPPKALERAQKAVQLLDERYKQQKNRSTGHGQSKEAELACVALGLADDFLQQESKIASLEERLRAIIEKIKNFE